MDTMRRVFVVLGVLMVVGFLGVDVARENRMAGIVDVGAGYNVGDSSKNPAGRSTTQSTPATTTFKAATEGAAEVPVPNRCTVVQTIRFEPVWGGVEVTFRAIAGKIYSIRSTGKMDVWYPTTETWRIVDADGKYEDDTWYEFGKDTEKNTVPREFWPPFPDKAMGGLILSINGGEKTWVGRSKSLSLTEIGETRVVLDANLFHHPGNYRHNEKTNNTLQVTLFECSL